MGAEQAFDWFKTQAEAEERERSKDTFVDDEREREEWSESEDGGVLVVGHNPPGLVTRPHDWPTT